VYKATLFMKLR